LIKDSEQYRQRNKELTKTLKKTYNDKGIKVLVSAYGALGNATINKTDPKQSAKELAAFVEECNFDGVDVDWEEKNTLNSSFY
jgi:chitinase